MTKLMKSPYLSKAELDDRRFCDEFKVWLAKFYGYRHKSLRRFADEIVWRSQPVYRQLNGTDPLSAELRAIMVKCMEAGQVFWKGRENEQMGD